MRFSAAGAAENGDDGVAFVVRPAEGQLEGLRLQIVGNGLDFALQFSAEVVVGRVVRLRLQQGQLQQFAGVVDLLLQAAPGAQRALAVGQTAHGEAGAFAVGPEIGVGGFALQTRRLRRQRGQVKDAPECRPGVVAAHSAARAGHPRPSSSNPETGRRMGCSVSAHRQMVARRSARRAMRAARVTLLSSIATVIGPTPPGTGVMNDAFSATAS